MTTNQEMTSNNCDVACSLPTEQQTVRLGELMNGLLGRVTNISELTDGYRLEFSNNPETRREIDAFIEFERQCCEFMTYTVTENSAGRVALELTGPQGTKEFLARWIGEIGSAGSADDGGDTMKRAGALGVTAAVFGAVCCATPALAAIMAALGIASATGAVATAIDTTMPLLLVGSVGLFVVGRRRQARAASAEKGAEDCGC